MSLLIRSCTTKGIQKINLQGPTSLVHKSQPPLELPYDEVKFLNNRLCFTVELLNKQYNNSITETLLHLCWGDIDNSKFFLGELTFSLGMRTGWSQNQKDILKNIRAILLMSDGLEHERMEMVCELDKWTQTDRNSQPENVEKNNLLYLAYKNMNERAWYSLAILYYLSESCENPRILDYLDRYKEKLVWIKDVYE